MQLVRGLHNVKDYHRGAVLTIGNFDGVHRGHQAILKRLVECAAIYQQPATVMIFEPHPEELFNAQQAPARLTRLHEKLVQFKRLHIERVVIVKFNRQFSNMSAEEFVTDLLLKKLGIEHLIVGDDFRFGNKRKGNYQLLQRLAKQHQFELESTDTLTEKDQRISSTAVRDALAEGKMELAKQLLARPYSISGKVFHGDKRGRTIGFPTANIHLHRCVSPLSGVYAVRLILDEGNGIQSEHQGVANIGRRPTVDGTRQQLEVHLFDFNQDIYGRAVVVEFLMFIRNEKKFSDFEQLKGQINKDAQSAREHFNH
ncbi:MAG: bifunctional riboflavin kinase/FMN adenylyltransferase [Gammaproteobacteria bacterium]|nr:MAG: bifunctional riboflavin kinase/FMN adenylyltransferase [Gammaproteobacteria bacterium]